MNLLGAVTKGRSGELRDLSGRGLGKPGRRVDARAHRRATERQLIHALQRSFDPLQIVRQHAGIAGPFLAQCQRRRVLHMGSADLDDVVPLLRPSRAIASRSAVTAGIRRCFTLTAAAMYMAEGNVVVRRLRHVDVIVGMNRRLAAERRAGELAASVGDHLVDVHVELGAAAGHPDMQREHVVMLAGENFVAGLNDQLVTLIVEPLAGVVGGGGGFLQGGIGGDHLARNQILADAEMLERALGLSAPQLVGRHFDHAEAVGLFSHVGHGISPNLLRELLIGGSIEHFAGAGVKVAPQPERGDDINSDPINSSLQALLRERLRSSRC